MCRRSFFFLNFISLCSVDNSVAGEQASSAISDCLTVVWHEPEDQQNQLVLYENPILEKRRNVRRNIKKVMDFENLTTETKIALKDEKERTKRYARRQQMVNILLIIVLFSLMNLF